MKIIHTADWHLGNTFHGHNRTDEHAHFLAWLLDTLEQQMPDALIISGDVFDSANPPAAAERQLYDFLLEATRRVEGLQIVLTAGNHDSAGRLEAPAELLRLHNIYVRGVSRRNEATGEPDFDHYLLPLSRRTDAEAQIVCLAVPYLRPADYPAGFTTTEGIAWFLDNLIRRLRKSPFKGLPVITAAHFYATGAEVCDNEHSERLVVGGQDCVEARKVDCGAAYTALGHIHKAQRVGNTRSEMHYAGSALPMSFSERHYRHGVQWIEINEYGKATVKRLCHTPLRGLISIPERGSATPEEVFAAIAALPKREKHYDSDTLPYLEIRVEERQPQPSLMHEVAQALEERAVHFCRMVREVPQENDKAQKENESLKTLRSILPKEMARRIFENRYHAEMTEEMLKRFLQAEEAVAADESGAE